MPRTWDRARRTLLLLTALIIAVAPALQPFFGAREGRAAPSASSPSALFSHSGVIKKGDKGDLVRALQEVLNALGYGTSADGIFGEATKTSLQKFQSDARINDDGIAGPATVAALSLRYYRENPPASHTVKKGETLSIIGNRYAISVETLARINGLRDPDSIYVGQVLRLAGEPVTTPPPDPDPVTTIDPEPATPVTVAPTKRVCLSFDDGPDVYTTRQILTILDTYGIKATFFLIGSQASSNRDLVKAIADAGHVIGVHGYDHKVLAGLSASEVRKDLSKAQDILEDITGVKPHLYRPPGGYLDRTQVEEAEKLGLTTLMWTNIGGADLGAASSQEVESRVLQGVKDGGVILLHEGLQYTVEALPSIIEALARAGYGFQNVTTAPVTK